MNKLQLRGCGTALVTPFLQNGGVDYPTFRKLVQRQIQAGIHFLVPLGTTGETPCLNNDEKIALIRIAKEESQGRVPIVIGVGTNCTAHVIDNIHLLEPYGADAYLVVTPYYNKPTQEGLKQHFCRVAESTDKAIILYNVPGRTGVNLSAKTCLELAQVPNICAVKEASGNYAQISQIIGQAPEGFLVFSGNDDETLSLMATGASGIISVASNIAPELMVKLTEALLAGDLKQAAALHHHLMPLFKNCFVESNPIPVKAGMALMGLLENNLRLPLTPASESTMTIMEKTLQELNLI